ncbi:MAG TPA: winged helix-turn-helix domain-containing tetratricopeptide repeat protein [Stellaceae bacterium]|nr:winged helix-turn-helix domain-containing tetratricopeptide repeat protein [Stellaceae bacterium]
MYPGKAFQKVPKRCEGRISRMAAARVMLKASCMGALERPMDRRDAGGGLIFGGFRLDRQGLFRLGRAEDGEPVALGSRALDLFRLLAERDGEVVSKDAIMAAVWPGIAVAESNLTVQVASLRRVLDRNRTQGSCIQTVPGRGYRLAAAIIRPDHAVPAPPAPAPADRPSIAVLPFRNLNGDPEQQFVADGIAEEIVTALSRIRWLSVLAHDASFAYEGKLIDVKQVGRDLGVRYVLEGSLRKSGGRVRIAGRLVDTASGAYVWADGFDGTLDNIFDLQDEVASRVAGGVEPALQAAEAARSASRSTEDLTAYDLYLRASAMYLSSARQTPEALRLLEKAVARDPYYGSALAWAAACCHRLLLTNRSGDRAADHRKAVEFARRALEVAGDDPGILANVAGTLASLDEDISAMAALADRALVLNPSYARGWKISGTIRLWGGEPDTAIEHVETALRLSPRARVGPSLGVIGTALVASRRFGEAVPKLLLAIQEDPSHPTAYRWLAACYAHMGRLDDARKIIARLLAITPVVVPDAGHFRDPEQRGFFLSGLRMAAGKAL